MEKEIWQLLVGEIIEEGDQVYCDGRWVKQIFLGSQLQPSSAPHRRKVKIPIGVDYSDLVAELKELRKEIKSLIDQKAECNEVGVKNISTKPKSVITMTESGIYKRRNGKNIILHQKGKRFSIVGDKEGRGYESDGIWTYNQESPEDIVLYVAPLNPCGTPLLNVKTGDELSQKFMYCSLGFKEWQLWKGDSHQRAEKDFIYAEYPNFEYISREKL